MKIDSRQYSMKRRGALFWRTGLTRNEILELAESQRLLGDEWLICPHGRSEQAVLLGRFAADTNAIGPSPFDDDWTTSFNPIGLWSLFVTGLVAFNFLGVVAIAIVPPMAPLLFGLVAGTILAQVGLVATWGVFSGASFLYRLATCAATGLVLYTSFAGGVLVVGGRDPEAPLALLFGLFPCPLMFFCVQAPLLAARNWLQWSIGATDDLRGSYLEPTGLKDFFTATAAAAVGLTLVRLAPLVLRPEDGADGAEYFLLVLCASASFGCILGVAPYVVMILAFDVEKSMFAALLAYTGCLLLGLIGFSLITMGITPEAFAAVVMIVSYVGVTGMGLGLARQSGFRLRFSKGSAVAHVRPAPPLAQTAPPR